MKLTLKQRLLLLQSLPLAGMIVILVAAFFGVAKVSTMLERLYKHPYAVATTIRSIESELISIHRDMKDVALARTPDEVVTIAESINKKLPRIENDLNLLEGRFLGDKSKISEIRALSRNWTEIRQKVIALVKAGNRNAATEITKSEGRDQVQRLLQATSSLREFADSKAEQFYSDSIKEVSSSKQKLFWTALLTVLISLLFGVYYAQAVSRLIATESSALTGNVDSLCDVAKTLGQKSIELSNVVSEQSRQFSTVSSASTEISATSASTSQKAQDLKIQVTELSEISKQGVDALRDLRESLDALKQTIQTLFKQLENNAESVSGLESTVKLVDEKASSVNEVVFQTKLLSFNASVEAARAGESGKGFAVVAEEIGQLASLSGRSADEIKVVVADATKQVARAASSIRAGASELSSTVNSSIQQSEAVTQLCENIFRSTFQRVEAINSLIVDVATASKEQSLGVANVEKAMGDLTKLSGVTLETAKNFSQLSKTVGSEVQNVEATTRELSRLVQG